MSKIFSAAAILWICLSAVSASAQQQFTREELDQLANQCPNFPSAYLLRGRMFMQQHSYDQAADDFKKAISLEQNRDDLHLLLGVSFFLARDYEKATESFDQAADIIDKKLEEIHKMRGESYFIKAWMNRSPADADNVIDSFSKLLLLRPDSAEAYYGRGRGFFAKAYFSSGDYSKAIEDFTKATALKPGFQEAERELESAKFHQAMRNGEASK